MKSSHVHTEFVERLAELINVTHPACTQIEYPKPEATLGDDLVAGTLTSIVVAHAPFLTVYYVPSFTVQFLFDEYAI